MHSELEKDKVQESQYSQSRLQPTVHPIQQDWSMPTAVSNGTLTGQPFDHNYQCNQ